MVALCTPARVPLRESALNKLKPCCEHTALHKTSHSWGHDSRPELERRVVKHEFELESQKSLFHNSFAWNFLGSSYRNVWTKRSGRELRLVGKRKTQAGLGRKKETVNVRALNTWADGLIEAALLMRYCWWTPIKLSFKVNKESPSKATIPHFDL